jgi:alkyldihydroxyacetonephosphate synthase
MRWDGWGAPARAVELPRAARKMLHDELGVRGSADGATRVNIDDVRIPASTLSERTSAALARRVGEQQLRADHAARVRHAAGRGYVDLVRLRSGELDAAPDAVLAPGDSDQVASVLERCAADGVAVVPFGGGTSVVGGVEPLRNSHAAVVALELGRLSGLWAVDERSLTATLAAGTTLPQAEAALAERGLMLGHQPQSFEYATVGGCVATRSAGQASTGYGRIDELVRGVELVAPAGRLKLPSHPASAAGPELRELVTGSEGTLGVITAATLDVRRLPETRHYEAWALPSFAEGADALRTLVQRDEAPEIARLSDEDETDTTLRLAGGGVAAQALRAYLRLRGRGGGCLLICGWEGRRADLGRRRSAAARVLRAFGSAALGSAPGRAWEHGRYQGPYLRDALLNRGVLVETLETAASWSQLDVLHRSVAGALSQTLAARGTPARVLCHISHLYPSGASLYFTFLARQEPGKEIEQWRAAKAAASEAIVRAGATITHHHAVGVDHRPYMEAEIGGLGLEALRALKQRLDPDGIMNPGKLL